MQSGTDSFMTNESKNVLIEKTIREYADMIYRLAFQYTGNESDAQDILQEVGLSLVTANPPFEDECYLRNWICRVTVNKCRNLNKHRKLRVYEVLDENIADNSSSQFSLREELAILPQKYRTVLYLHYYEEFSIEEISKALGVNKNTVGSQLRRGREKLRKILSEGE